MKTLNNNFKPKAFNGISPEALVSAMENVSKGCEKSFNTIFKAFQEPLSNWLKSEYKIGFDVANDLVIEILTKVWEKSSHYESERGHVTTWIYSIAEFHMVDYFRREQTKRNYFSIYKLILMNDMLLVSDYETSKLTENPERILLKKERRSLISGLFSEKVVGKGLAKIMELRYSHELSLNEVIEETGVNESTLRVNLLRGRKKIVEFINSSKEYSEVFSL